MPTSCPLPTTRRPASARIPAAKTAGCGTAAGASSVDASLPGYAGVAAVSAIVGVITDSLARAGAVLFAIRATDASAVLAYRSSCAAYLATAAIARRAAAASAATLKVFRAADTKVGHVSRWADLVKTSRARTCASLAVCTKRAHVPAGPAIVRVGLEVFASIEIVLRIETKRRSGLTRIDWRRSADRPLERGDVEARCRLDARAGRCVREAPSAEGAEETGIQRSFGSKLRHVHGYRSLGCASSLVSVPGRIKNHEEHGWAEQTQVEPSGEISLAELWQQFGLSEGQGVGAQFPQ